MESTVYGHPGEPRTGASLPAALRAITRGNFGLTFEENGLRANVELERKESSSTSFRSATSSASSRRTRSGPWPKAQRKAQTRRRRITAER